MKTEIDSKDLAELENKIWQLQNDKQNLLNEIKTLSDPSRQLAMVGLANDVFNNVMRRVFKEMGFGYENSYWYPLVDDLISKNGRLGEAIDSLSVSIAADISNRFRTGYINLIKEQLEK
jgi:conjugal transfer/entry exclusion protein